MQMRSCDLRWGAKRFVLYDELGGVALDYHTRQNTVALLSGAAREGPGGRGFAGGCALRHRRTRTDTQAHFRQHVYEGDQKE
jgi:hypothetical protein